MTSPRYRVGVVGWPVDHSLSPVMHNAAFAALGLADWHYDKFPVPPDVLRLSLRELRDHHYVGVNVTVPHKEAAVFICKPDPLAQRVGAVNTIDFRTNGGTNTDVGGFMDDLAAHDIPVIGQRVIVLGAGGAARAAVYGLAQAGARVIVVNRTPERAHTLVKELFVEAEVLTLADAARTDARLIINTTSAGMGTQAAETPWPDDVPLPIGVIVYDMVYRPAHTVLMKQVQASGGRAFNGLGMLVRQGAAAFTLWTGQPAPLDVMFDAVNEALKA